MKLLFDANLSHKLAVVLADIFPGSSRVRTVDLGRQSDQAIWGFAKTHEFIIVTLDQDFYDMSCYYGFPPKVVWMRTGNQSTRVYEQIIREQFKLITRFASDSDAACLELA
ncbi:MAG: DUF5615 family PIN-like protein [Kiritimatiellia bacterium]